MPKKENSALKAFESRVEFPQDLKFKDKAIRYSKTYKERIDINIGLNDTLDYIQSIPDASISLIVSSPPYNIGKPYEERIEFEQYLSWQSHVLQECKRILKPDGNICWEVGNHVKEGEVYPLDVFFYPIFKELGFNLRNRLIWHFGHGLHAQKRFSGRYEIILWFSKSSDYIFNLDPVRVPQKYPGKRAYKGRNKGKPSGNPLGKNPSDLWEIIEADWENQLWNIPNVKSNHPEKTIHPCQFPIELVERLILALSNPGDLIFDPFMGVGSTLLAGLIHGRKVIGVDKEKEFTDIAVVRVRKYLEGSLKKRRLGKPVHKPRGTEKVVQKPLEWRE